MSDTILTPPDCDPTVAAARAAREYANAAAAA